MRAALGLAVARAPAQRTWRASGGSAARTASRKAKLGNSARQLPGTAAESAARRRAMRGASRARALLGRRHAGVDHHGALRARVRGAPRVRWTARAGSRPRSCGVTTRAARASRSSRSARGSRRGDARARARGRGRSARAAARSPAKPAERDEARLRLGARDEAVELGQASAKSAASGPAGRPRARAAPRTRERAELVRESARASRLGRLVRQPVAIGERRPRRRGSQASAPWRLSPSSRSSRCSALLSERGGLDGRAHARRRRSARRARRDARSGSRWISSITRIVSRSRAGSRSSGSIDAPGRSRS